MNNEIYGTKWAGSWAIENTSVTNCVPIAQRNTVKFFCINPDDSNATWYFDNLVPEVGKISPTLTPHIALNSLNNFAGSTTWNVQRRYIEGNSSVAKSAMGCDVITEYKYRNKAAENRKWYSWSKNFMIAPTSGYFAANKIRQYLDEEARWYLSSGILLSKKCESSKLVLVVNGKTPVASDTIKIAASRNPFTNGISTTSTADYYKINGKIEPAEIKSNVNTKISIAAEKGKECYLMVTSSKGQDITFEILKNQSYWEIE